MYVVMKDNHTGEVVGRITQEGDRLVGDTAIARDYAEEEIEGFFFRMSARLHMDTSYFIYDDDDLEGKVRLFVDGAGRKHVRNRESNKLVELNKPLMRVVFYDQNNVAFAHISIIDGVAYAQDEQGQSMLDDVLTYAEDVPKATQAWLQRIRESGPSYVTRVIENDDQGDGFYEVQINFSEGKPMFQRYDNRADADMNFAEAVQEMDSMPDAVRLILSIQMIENGVVTKARTPNSDSM
jgi:hypothetical protein